LGVTVAEPNLTRYEVMTADECFLTGTAAELVPVVSLDGRSIGNGKPGALTLKLMEEFHKVTRTEGTPIGEV
jgi:branched-chain amino acid aminotransferase